MCHAIEIRHESFFDTSFIELLRDYGVALVILESAGRWPMIQDVTATFMYLRLHGDRELYRSGYSDPSLARWARRIAAWHRGIEPKGAMRIGPRSRTVKRGRDVYVFFDNTDVKLRAPYDAQTLIKKLKA